MWPILVAVNLLAETALDTSWRWGPVLVSIGYGLIRNGLVTQVFSYDRAVAAAIVALGLTIDSPLFVAVGSVQLLTRTDIRQFFWPALGSFGLFLLSWSWVIGFAVEDKIGLSASVL